ncbi:lytic transglycosylase domain-containing protein [Pseudoalteromonas tunicata]|uniref:lytic transglycosylase domain-containing protein n=1 Tax=Pseudoalteromonas tunicata TaxID=314281 RepID=UPI002740294C|nr:lytic transglycosylase domain-containing protein [Pseudoalteromonas tunicata]MDP5212647.1 lytic transglycosylase domain-containing protein [Pseudoalteromonas tunicata]
MLRIFCLTILLFNCLSIYAKDKVVYQYIQANGTIAFTDQKPMAHKYNVLKYDCFACRVDSSIDWYHTKLFKNDFNAEITQASLDHNIPAALIRAVIHAESAFKYDALSKKGAVGLMQLMPTTAKELGVKNLKQPRQNIDGGTKYFAQLLDTFKGNVKLAAAAYNAGPNAVKKYSGIPPFEETQAYVKRVSILHQRYQQALLLP